MSPLPLLLWEAGSGRGVGGYADSGDCGKPDDLTGFGERSKDGKKDMKVCWKSEDEKTVASDESLGASWPALCGSHDGAETDPL